MDSYPTRSRNYLRNRKGVTLLFIIFRVKKKDKEMKRQLTKQEEEWLDSLNDGYGD